MSEPVLLHEDTINKLAEVLAEKIRAPEKWIDIETLAAHFGVSLDTVYYWSSKTNIPRNKEGRELRFKISEVERWYCGRSTGR